MSKDQEGAVAHDQLESYDERKKKWYLDVRNTPCARNALIHGILGGLVVGLLYFAKTNVVRKSCDWAVGGFGILSLGSWEFCRMQKAKQRADVKKTVQVLNTLNHSKSTGSESSSTLDGQQSDNDSISSVRQQ